MQYLMMKDLLLLFQYCSIVQLMLWAIPNKGFAQHPTLHPTPYWVKAMDEKHPDYIQALESYSSFWNGLPIPIENFSLYAEIKGKKNRNHQKTEYDTADKQLLWLKARQFHRWAWSQRSFFRRNGKLPSAKEWKELALQRTILRNELISADWTPTGPNSAIMDPLPMESRVGRMVQIRFHPHNPSKVYAVSGSGGLFVSENHGLTWEVLGTDVLPFGYQPSSVCIDYNDDQIMYIGMGDPNFGSQGHGVWKSLNGGNTWFDSSGEIGDQVVYDILMSPKDYRILHVAADEGLWRSTDSGQHWEKKQALQHDAILDMIYKPGSADTIYACTFSKFFRSVDDGNSWQEITNGIQLPQGGGRGMRLAVSDADPDIVYLGMISNHGTVFKSVDAGTTFQMVYQDTLHQSLTTYTGLINSESNGQYNFSMAADPRNADVVYFGTQTLWKSTDGGVSWTSLYPYLYRVHPDIHDLEFSSLDYSLFNVNDGGIAVSPDGGTSWYQRNDGMVTAEIYNGAQSPIRRDMMIIGTQDNGALGFRKSKWIAIEHGDVYDRFWFDYHTSDRYYSDNGYSKGLEQRLTYKLNWPFNGLGSRKFAFTEANTSVAFLCQNEVWRCLDINSLSPVWKKISEPFSNNNGDYIRDLVIAPNDANKLYALMGNSKILYTQNALSPIPVFDTLSTPSSSSFYQSSLAVSKQNPEIIYFAGWNQIFRSMDSGEHWTEITENLPDQNIYRILHDDYEPYESIYALCGNHVYYRNDSIGSWVEYGQGLPSLAYVSDLQMYNDGSRKSLIRAITYGRGVFETPMFKTRAIPHCDFIADNTNICPDGVVTFTDASIDANSWVWEFEGGIPSTFSGQYPPPVIYPHAGVFAVTLIVANVHGEASKMKVDFIQVNQSVTLPFQEDFEEEFPPHDFEWNSLAPNNVRWTHGSLGSYGQSGHCSVFIDNPPFSKAEMKWAADFSDYGEGWLSFDIAYGKREGSTIHDTLEVLVSVDCGKTYTTIYKRGGDHLATMPDINNVLSFNPTSDEWRTENVDMSPYAGYRYVIISIQAYGEAQEVIALDNIQLDAATPTRSFSSDPVPDFDIFPNPATDKVWLRMKSISEGNILITSVQGDYISAFNVNANWNEKNIPLGTYPHGIYLVTLRTRSSSLTKRIIVH